MKENTALSLLDGVNQETVFIKIDCKNGSAVSSRKKRQKQEAHDTADYQKIE